MSIYALNLINGLGLGLAIDYSLFMVSRFREELARRHGPRGGAAHDAAHRGPRGRLRAITVAARAGGADRLPPALPVLDGRRRDAVRADRRRRLADAAAGAAGHPRRARQRRRAAALEGGDRARGAGRAQRLLVPPLAARDAPPGRVRDRRRGAADRARRAVPEHPVHRHRPVACCPPTSRRGSSTTRSRPSSRRARRRRSTSPSATRRPAEVRAYAARLPRAGRAAAGRARAGST